MNGFNPKVTIITVTFNAEKELEKTILSILHQTWKNIEYIIIDGKSTDKTVEIIKKYEDSITKWISEPDTGLYDAMNKGISLSTGDYLWFINAGDEIYSIDTLEKLLLNFPGMDIYYGETMLSDTEGNDIGTRSRMTSQKLPENLTWKKMNKGMVVNHQSVIVKKSIAPDYDLSYRYSADIDWTIKCLKNTSAIQSTEMILSRFMSNRVLGKFHAGGESRSHLFISLRERFHLLKYHYGLLPALWFHIVIFMKALRFFFSNNS